MRQLPTVAASFLAIASGFGNIAVPFASDDYHAAETEGRILGPAGLQESAEPLDPQGITFERALTATVNRTTWSDAYSGSVDELGLALGDLDADGDLDLVRGSRYRLEWTENIGNSQAFLWESLEWGNVMENENRFFKPVLVDIDADGDLDLFCGQLQGQIAFFENIGSSAGPLWAAPDLNYSGIDIGWRARPRFADIDADGDHDLFIGNSEGSIFFYANAGRADAPEFVLQSAGLVDTGPGGAVAPSFVDIDNDCDLDMFVGTQYGKIRFYRNDGTKQNASWDLVSEEYAGVDLGWSHLQPEFADLDGDLDQDLLFTDLNGIVHVRQNLGTIAHPRWSAEKKKFLNVLDFGRPSAPAVGDIDADGDMDVLIGTHVVQVLGNIGTAEAPAWQWKEERVIELTAFWVVPELADIDADGDLDLFVGTVQGALYFYENVGTPNDAKWQLITDHYLGLDFGGNSHVSNDFADIDGDGDLDMFVQHHASPGDQLYFYRNNGTAREPSWTLVDTDYMAIGDHVSFGTSEFVDLDEDRDLDALLGDDGGRYFWYENLGNVQQPQWVFRGLLAGGIGNEGSSRYSTPVAVDIDNDSHVDILSGLDTGGLNLWCNGQGRDGDGDGMPDCADGCPSNPDKIVPGACGCDRPETDGDADGTADCNDLCRQDPTDNAPGRWGCGFPDFLPMCHP